MEFLNELDETVWQPETEYQIYVGDHPVYGNTDRCFSKCIIL